MKVLAVCGSPRSGNTETLLKRILNGAMESGAHTELVLLKDKNIKLCDGCSRCAKTKSCHILDDMQHIYHKAFTADILILGSPNYFNNVSGLMKNFIDRFSPYWEDKLKGKKAVLAVVGTEGGTSLRYPANTLKHFCKICGIRVLKTIKAKAEAPRDALQNHELLLECFETGKKIMQRPKRKRNIK